MDEKMRELLDGLFIYLKILNDVNLKTNELINQNIKNEPFENEQLFYEISSEIIRLLPLRKRKGETGEAKEVVRLDCSSGILLLKEGVPFLEESYRTIVEDKGCKMILINLSNIRNKFVHEPHNMNFCYSVGAETSCGMGLYYKDSLWAISTIDITYILYELNEIFDRVKKLYIEKAIEAGKKYVEYPCYKTVLGYDFKKYNESYMKIPSDYVERMSEELDEVLLVDEIGLREDRGCCN